MNTTVLNQPESQDIDRDPCRNMAIMWRRFRLFILLGILAFTLIIGYQRLAQRDVPTDIDTRAQTAKAVVVDLVDHAIFQILDNLTANANQLHQSAMSFQAQPVDSHLTSTASALRESLGAWHLTVTCQFGPATQYDYHKRIATWPCDTVLIEHVIAQVQAGQITINPQYLREQHYASLRGLHAVQYLLYRDGKLRSADSFTDAELAYLTAVTQSLLQECIDFEAAWRGTENLPADKLAIIKAAGIPTRKGYADEFKYPGRNGSRYASVAVSLQEVLQDLTGCIEDIAVGMDELPIGDQQQTPAYWDSLDPIEDLLKQIQSIKVSYLGGFEGKRGRSISELVAAHDQALDRLIQISLAHTAYRTAAIGDLKDATQDQQELAVRIAQSELKKLNARLFAATPLVVLDPAADPYAAYR
ncbi:MAG: imelysin family protein [Phycisphaeraceae bacterium JB051]